MANVSVCDICTKPLTPDNPRVFKIYLSPVVASRTRSQHSHYTKHLDVGRCCSTKVHGLGRWQTRKTQKRAAAG